MSVWHPATVARRDPVGGDVFRLTLGVPQVISSSYHRPGQYHRLSLDGVNSAYFAIASPPGSTAFEYVVRHQGHVAGQLEKLKPGDHLQVSEVEGAGFPVHLLRGHDALLVATGTGFGPIRAAVEVMRARRGEIGEIVVLYGALNTEALAWREDFAAWRKDRVDVRPVLFTPETGWQGRTGWVQHHLDGLPLSNSFAFLCGHRAMEDEVRAGLVSRGLRPEHVFTNT